MSERILIPLDGSDLGEAAVEYVKNLIKRLSPEQLTTVVLFNVLTTLNHEPMYSDGGAIPVALPYSREEMEKLAAERRAYLDKVGKELKQSGVEVKTQVVQGNNPAEEIIKAEEEFNCDLVAMSTHGHSGLKRWAFGSVTDKVLRGGSIPVLLVRTN